MIALTRVKEATAEFIKVLRFGKQDVVTADQYTPAGIDSKPIKEKLAVYVKTGDRQEPIILGYINNSEITLEGETRIYSEDASGNTVRFIHCKVNGDIEFSGSSDNLLRYIPLNTAILQQATDINTELTKIAAAINAIVPGSYVPTPISIDISNSKINEFKSL